MQALAYCALTSILLAIALVDLDTFTIPNGCVLAGIAVWALTVCGIPPAFENPNGCACGIGSAFAGVFGETWIAVAADGVAAAFLFGGGMLLFSVAFDLVTGRRSLGGGDIKLLFMVGLFLGLLQSFLNLMLSCFMGLAFFVLFGNGNSNGNSNGNVGGDGDAIGNVNGSRGVEGTIVAEPVNPMASGASDPVPEKAFPFGPAIALSTVMVLLFGREIIGAYLALL